MKYRHRDTGHIYELHQIQEMHSNTSFPVIWDATTYDYLHMDPVHPAEVIPDLHEYETLDFSIEYIDGKWMETWSVRSLLTSDELAQKLIEEKLVKWETIRTHRDGLLRETDYIEFPTTPITDSCREEFRVYRQALRDITLQSDPFNLHWPTLPIYRAK